MHSLRRLKDDDARTLERRLIDSDPNLPMPSESRQALRAWAARLNGGGNGSSPPGGESTIEALTSLRWGATKWFLLIASGTCLVLGAARWETRDEREDVSTTPPAPAIASEPPPATPSESFPPPQSEPSPATPTN